MRSIKSIAFSSMLAALALLSLESDAAADGYTYVQSNGVECNPANTFAQDVLTYGWGGLRNPTANPSTVVCPITRASADSQGPTSLHKAPIDAFVYFSGADTLTCEMRRHTKTGGFFIKNMIKDTVWPTRSRMRGRLEVDDLADTIFEYVYCTLPPGAVIRGMISYQELKATSGGGITVPVTPYPTY
jgi:hypothetical protein